MYNMNMSPTEVRISKDALINNYNILSSLESGEVWPVIKSNAYGHGSQEVVSCLDDQDFSHYIVQHYYEAEELFNHTEKKFLMLGFQPLDLYKGIDHKKVTIMVPSIALLEHLVSLNTEFIIHLEINTGMNRHGIDPQELIKALKILKDSKIELEGIMTHFASTDETDLSSLRKQEGIFKEIQERFPGVRYVHGNNSAGAVTSNIRSDIVRAGILLYGLSPFEDSEMTPRGIIPAMEYVTHITSVRNISPGDTVGYGDTFKATKEMTLATVPVGYHEGIARALSNKGFLLIKDTPCPIIGRVSMNITTIDVSHLGEINVGEEVTILSGLKGNQAGSLADIADTIHYEITTNIKSHIPRVVI